MYEGITFDDFLKVGAWEGGACRGCGRRGGLRGGPAGQETSTSVERGRAWVWPLKQFKRTLFTYLLEE